MLQDIITAEPKRRKPYRHLNKLEQRCVYELVTQRGMQPEQVAVGFGCRYSTILGVLKRETERLGQA